MDFNITRTYVPFNKKMESIMRVLAASLDNTTGTYKVGFIELFSIVELARLYTDIELPEDGIVEAYDMLAENNFDFTIKCTNHKAKTDVDRYIKIMEKQIEKLEFYQTSIYGILDSIKNDYNNLDFDVTKLKKELEEAEGFNTVKTIVEKLG